MPQYDAPVIFETIVKMLRDKAKREGCPGGGYEGDTDFRIRIAKQEMYEEIADIFQAVADAEKQV